MTGTQKVNVDRLTAYQHEDLTDGKDSDLHYHTSDRNRGNHTGTQTADTISDFAAAVVLAAPTKTMGMCFDGGGSPPTAGSIGYLVAQITGTITGWHMVADASGSAVVDVWKAAGSIPVNANTIAGSEKPTLSAQQLNSDSNLTTWSTSVVPGDVLGFELESASTCTRVTCELSILGA